MIGRGLEHRHQLAGVCRPAEAVVNSPWENAEQTSPHGSKPHGDLVLWMWLLPLGREARLANVCVYLFVMSSRNHLNQWNTRQVLFFMLLSLECLRWFLSLDWVSARDKYHYSRGEALANKIFNFENVSLRGLFFAGKQHAILLCVRLLEELWYFFHPFHHDIESYVYEVREVSFTCQWPGEIPVTVLKHVEA